MPSGGKQTLMLKTVGQQLISSPDNTSARHQQQQTNQETKQPNVPCKQSLQLKTKAAFHTNESISSEVLLIMSPPKELSVRVQKLYQVLLFCYFGGYFLVFFPNHSVEHEISTQPTWLSANTKLMVAVARSSELNGGFFWHNWRNMLI